jgi:hypothetical protein
VTRMLGYIGVALLSVAIVAPSHSPGQKLCHFAVSEGSSRVGWASPIMHGVRGPAENGSLELMERCVEPLLS